MVPKNVVRPINSNKNKLNNKIILIFNRFLNAYLKWEKQKEL